MRFTLLLAGSMLLAATPAFAQDAAVPSGDSVAPAASETAPPAAFTVSGSLTGVTDYRLRGVSQTDKHAAVQGTLTIAHESGFYIGAFGSNLAGWGTFGGANLELDAIGGFKHAFGATTVDAGVTWYTYPGGFSESDVVEFFGKVSGTVGPAAITAGVLYAPTQTSLGRIYRNATEYANGVGTGSKRWDNLYLTADAAIGIPSTPITLKGHLGGSKGNPGLGPNGTSLSPTGEYMDWSVGADLVAYKNLTLNVSYIDTDISNSESAYLAPNFRSTKDGSSIAGSTVLFSLTAGF